MMHGTWLFWIRILLLLLLGDPSVQARLLVVATTADLAALARAVGGDRVEVLSLARPTEDPHFVDPRPSYLVQLARADALVHGGAGLEAAWLTPLLNRAGNARILPAARGHIRCCEGVTLLEVPEKLDRSQGDVHAAGNPHYLADPQNARIVVHHLADTFVELDFAGTEIYRKNQRAFVEALERSLPAWEARLRPFAGARLVSYHNSWPYFALRFNLRIDLFLEPKPGIPPSAAHLGRVVAEMKASGVRAILVEPYQDRRAAETVARATGARLVPVTQYPGGLKGTEAGYLELMDYLVRAITGALSDREQASTISTR
ncbi:MAG: metal ABC transporter substrate-binding protein [Verrucomicrobiota bacterium]|nr:metal ABC transporter substrate-binding protein [Limisphaera sp.]MDW8380581.1 metal ABC transporter substrate-binding protein [Verrucomicrobiota bacterium]